MESWYVSRRLYTRIFYAGSTPSPLRCRFRNEKKRRSIGFRRQQQRQHESASIRPYVRPRGGVPLRSFCRRESGYASRSSWFRRCWLRHIQMPRRCADACVNPVRRDVIPWGWLRGVRVCRCVSLTAILRRDTKKFSEQKSGVWVGGCVRAPVPPTNGGRCRPRGWRSVFFSCPVHERRRNPADTGGGVV